MKLISMKCPHCGGTLSIDPDGKQAKCPFCETPIMIDDEVRHIQFDNSKQAGYDFEVGHMQAGYDFEVGRMQARRDAAVATIAEQQREEKKKKNLKWWIIGWILFFPIPLTIIVVRSKKLKTLWKIIILVAIWGGFILIGLSGEKEKNETPAPQPSITSMQCIAQFDF
jgi:endogenous inhibitor of DNA gyrase (YacG/DUF329 family)